LADEKERYFCLLASFRLGHRPLRACSLAKASPAGKNPRSKRPQNFLTRSSWLLPLCYDGHEHHATALRWLEALPAGGQVILCRAAQMGLLRLIGNPAVMGASACDSAGSWRVMDQLLGDSRFGFEQEPAGVESEFRRQTAGHRLITKLWQDAYLAAFAIVSDAHLVTFDQDFRNFRRLKALILTMD